MLLRILSAAAQRVASKPRVAPLLLLVLLFLAARFPTWYSYSLQSGVCIRQMTVF